MHLMLVMFYIIDDCGLGEHQGLLPYTQHCEQQQRPLMCQQIDKWKSKHCCAIIHCCRAAFRPSRALQIVPESTCQQIPMSRMSCVVVVFINV